MVDWQYSESIESPDIVSIKKKYTNYIGGKFVEPKSKKYINTISLISPTTKKDRIESIAKNSSGFVYYVTLRGVTGASNLDVNEINENIEEIKKHASVPTLAGFGIKSTEDAKLLSKCSDGVIVGSSIVQMIEENSKSKEFDRIKEYITELKMAIS